MKKLFAILLSIVLTVQLAVPAWAAGGEEPPETVPDGYTETDPTPEPTPEPTAEPTAEPTVEPTEDELAEDKPVLLAAVSVASGTCGDNLAWTLSDDGVLTISGTGNMGYYSGRESAPWYNQRAGIVSVIIESGVTSIGNCAFLRCSSIASIAIPSSVTSIGDYAFSGCTGLTSITIPSSVTSIEDKVFSGCTSLTSIMIPSGVTSIGEYAFDGCTNLKSVTIPSSVKSIWECAFDDCTALEGVYISDMAAWCGIHFDNGAFSKSANPLSYAHKLYLNGVQVTELAIPNNVKSIGSYAFCDGTAFKSVTIPNSVTSIGGSAFSGCTGLTSITIPKGATYIGGSAFSGCTGLTSITIPNSVRSIGDSAFSGCVNLTGAFPIPNGARIGSYAFSGCSKLTGTVTIADSATSIGAGTFYGCAGLTGIKIPKSVTAIGNNAFSGCTSLASVHYTGSEVDWNLIDIGSSNEPLQNAVKTYDEQPVPDYSGKCGDDLTWKLYKDGTLTIEGTGAMYDFSGNVNDWDSHAKEIKTVRIEEGATSIGNSAFRSCFYLADVTIPASVKSIGNYAFSNASNNMRLTELTIPEGVESIGAYAFECGELTSLTIPSSVTSIGVGAFIDNRKLTNLEIVGSITSMGRCAFQNCPKLTNVTIAQGTTVLGDFAFNGCYALPEITIPKSVKSVGGAAFGGCTALEGVYISDMAAWCGIEFNTSSSNPLGYAHNLYLNGELVTDLVIPDSVTAIGEYAFYGGTGFKSVTIPESVTSIGSSAFYDCTGLTDVYYSSCSETKWNSISIKSGNDNLKNATVHYSKHRWGEGVVTTPATRTEEGEKTFTCSVCQTTRTETIPALTPEPGSVDLNDIAKDFDGSAIDMDVDGKTIVPDGKGNYPDLTVPEGTVVLLSVSTYNLPENADPHTRYPVGMAVYKLTNTGGTVSVERISELDNLLRYAGSSIRITGNKGIRMITGIDSSLKKALTGGGAAGYTLEEYGTVLAWTSESGSGLSLSDGYARHNYAYSRANGTDPVFRYAGDTIQYTNVLVGFSSEQCVDDIAMRPYITLRDADGNTYTLYGGIVNRSIGYIACQNRSAFAPGTGAYNYIWDIIHFVYGDAYDEDYKG